MEDLEGMAAEQEAARKGRVLAALLNRKETFDIPLAGGDKITFRLPADADDFYALREGGRRWAKAMQTAAPPEHRRFLPLGGQAITAAWWVHKLAVDPPLSELETLRIAKQGGGAIVLLHEIIQQEISEFINLSAAAEIDEAGEDLRPTPSRAPISTSASTSSTSTPTTGKRRTSTTRTSGSR